MKKDRNTFFQEAQFAQYGNVPNNQMMMPNNMMAPGPGPMPNGMPMQPAMSSSQYYYAPDMNASNNSDIESKIAKMERQIRSLENRISKIESGMNYTSDIDNVSNMYII